MIQKSNKINSTKNFFGAFQWHEIHYLKKSDELDTKGYSETMHIS